MCIFFPLALRRKHTGALYRGICFSPIQQEVNQWCMEKEYFGRPGCFSRYCRKKRSFTLIELIMILVIIGIMAAMAAPRFMNFRSEAEEAAEEATIAAVQSGINIQMAAEEARK